MIQIRIQIGERAAKRSPLVEDAFDGTTDERIGQIRSAVDPLHRHRFAAHPESTACGYLRVQRPKPDAQAVHRRAEF